MSNSKNKALTIDQRIKKDLNELNTIGEIQDAIKLDGLVKAKPAASGSAYWWSSEGVIWALQ